MGRPAKAISTSSGKIGKEKMQERLEQETKLKGKSDKIKPPTYLSFKQKKIFKYIVAELEASGILSNLDIYMLTTCCIAIDRLQGIEALINEDIEKLMDSKLMASKDKYTKDLFRCASELSLSPQARAKLGSLNIQTKENSQDPVLLALKGKK